LTSPKGRTKKIAFDTSFLFAVAEKPTAWREDILEKVGAFVPVVPRSVREELDRLAAKGGKKGRQANLAIALLEAGGFSVEPDGGGKPDDELMSFALREGAGVATVDSELAKRLRASGVSTVVTLRQGRVHV